MQHALSTDRSTGAHSVVGARAARRAGIAAQASDLYEFRTYAYTDGWDSDDAELGWVDADVVRETRQSH